MFIFWGKLKRVVYANNPHDLEALKQNICEATDNILQCELQQVSRNLQRVDILNIFYDGENNINYYL
jgi:hypothetical protein